MTPLIGITCGTRIREMGTGYSAGLLEDAILRDYSGGGDIAPYRFDEENAKMLGSIDSERDDTELHVLQRALARGLPVLGICRGIQTLNVGLGGTLYQDIATQTESDLKHWNNPYRSPKVHKVRIEPGNLLRDIVGEEEIWVNSLHHQAIRELGRE